MSKNYSTMDVAITLNNLHESTDEGDSLLEDVAIPHENLDSFLADVVALAEKHGGAGFLELMDNDWDDTSITAAIKRNVVEHTIQSSPRMKHAQTKLNTLQPQKTLWGIFAFLGFKLNNGPY